MPIFHLQDLGEAAACIYHAHTKPRNSELVVRYGRDVCKILQIYIYI
jgi:hypothetical protein